MADADIQQLLAQTWTDADAARSPSRSPDPATSVTSSAQCNPTRPTTSC